ncbi:MAG: M1 family aminopeptidase [Gemmatimonadaceae bacterium]
MPAARPGLAVLEGAATITPDSREIMAEWDISFVPAMRDSAVISLNAGFRVTGLRGPLVERYSSEVQDGVLRVTVHLKATSGASPTTVHVAYAGVLEAPGDSINGLSHDWIELGADSYWQPSVDLDRDVARVRLIVPNGFTLAASGSFARDGDSVFVLTNAIPLPDVAFTGSRAFMRADSGGTSVLFTKQRTPLVGVLLATTESCAQYLNEVYGARESLPHRTMVLAPRGGPGYARKNYIVITQVDTSAVGVARFVCHELAHFWSLRANSQGPDNWLNEGIAEFVAAQYVRTLIGTRDYDSIVESWRRVAQNQPAVWTPQLTRRPSGMVAYRKAPFLLTQLEAHVGMERMSRIIQRYMVEEITTTPELLKVIEQEAGSGNAEWFRVRLSQ